MGCTQAKPSSHAKKNQNNGKQNQQQQNIIPQQSNRGNQDLSKSYQKNKQTSILKDQTSQLINQTNNEYKALSQVNTSKLQNPQINIYNVQGQNKPSEMLQNSHAKSKIQQKSVDINEISKSKLSSNKNIGESPSLQIQSLKKQEKQESNLQASLRKSVVSSSQKKQIQKGILNQTVFVNNKTSKPINQRMIQSTGKLLEQNKAFKNNNIQNNNKKIQNQIDESSKQDTFSTEIKKQKHSLLMGNPKLYQEEDKVLDMKGYKKEFQSLMEQPKKFEDRFNNNRNNSFDLTEKNNQKKINLNIEEPQQKIEGQQGKINKVAESSIPHRTNNKNNIDQMNQSQNNLQNSKYMKQMQNKIITQVEQEKYSNHQQNNNRPVEKEVIKTQKKLIQNKNVTIVPQIHMDQSHYSTKPDPRVNIILFESKNSNQSKKTVSKFNNNNIGASNQKNNYSIGASNQKNSPKQNNFNQYSNMSINQSRFAKQKLDDFSINSDYVLDEQQCRYSMGMSKVKIQVQI